MRFKTSLLALVAVLLLSSSAFAKVDCSQKAPMFVHFYDISQALAALVELPDGRFILVDAGEAANNSLCKGEEECLKVYQEAHKHLMKRLEEDLDGKPISMLWITHQHSDHIGGAEDVIKTFNVETYVDNGRNLEKGLPKKVHDALKAKKTKTFVVDPTKKEIPIISEENLKLTAVVPTTWPESCTDAQDPDKNDCSIALRIDYCDSSTLFVGDAGKDEEKLLTPLEPVTLLQVGHHGSRTSTGTPFLTAIMPQYAVIPVGRPGEGMNKSYCHPLRVTLKNLSKYIGGEKKRTILGFSGELSCKHSTSEDWEGIEVSKRVWSTAIDGDVSLMTTGDGEFERVKRAE